jgi:hypothetical protein
MTAARLTAREVATVLGVLAVVHAALWARGVPLPHQDLLFYSEPAVHLAREGKLIAPGAQYIDLTYGVFFAFYPPGYALCLAPWIGLFGFTTGAMLAFAHLVHAAYLAALWILLRTRFGVGRAVAALVLASCFPFFNFGRPELVAILLGTCSWLVVPMARSPGRFFGAAALAGLALITSPSFGIGSVAAVVAFVALGEGRLTRASARRAAIFAAAIAAVALGVWAAVITWQSAWSLAVRQYRVNSGLRAAELNLLPERSWFTSGYFVAFSLLPLFVATIGPAVAVLLRNRGGTDREPSRPAWLASAIYLATFVPVFLTNKTQLLLAHHYGVVPRPVLHGALASARRPWRFVGVAATLLFALAHFYYSKETFIYAFSGDFQRAAIDPRIVGDARVIAVDSNYAPEVYGRRDDLVVLDYQIIKVNYWRRYLAATSPAARARIPERLRGGPDVPDVILVSTRGIMQGGGPPNPVFYEEVSGPPVAKFRLFGRPLEMADHPLALHVYRRRPGVPIPAAL